MGAPTERETIAAMKAFGLSDGQIEDWRRFRNLYPTLAEERQVREMNEKIERTRARDSRIRRRLTRKSTE